VHIKIKWKVGKLVFLPLSGCELLNSIFPRSAILFCRGHMPTSSKSRPRRVFTTRCFQIYIWSKHHISLQDRIWNRRRNYSRLSRERCMVFAQCGLHW